jgi:hypothetical protein
MMFSSFACICVCLYVCGSICFGVALRLGHAATDGHTPDEKTMQQGLDRIVALLGSADPQNVKGISEYSPKH